MANSRYLEDGSETGSWDDSLSHGMHHMKKSPRSQSKNWTPPPDDISRMDITSEMDGSLSSLQDSGPDGNILMYSSSESWSMAQDFINSRSPSLLSPVHHGGPHHHRSGSHRVHRPRHPKAYMKDDMWDIGEARPRLFSMPTGCPPQKPEHVTSCGTLGKVARVRSFVITHKGLVSQGECFLKRSSTLESNHDKSPIPDYMAVERHRKRSRVRVVILGSSGVGKHSLIDAFVKDRNSDNGTGFEDEADKSVSILLDGEESTIEFVDFSDRQVDDEIKNESADGFVVVYSVEDRRSYEASINRLLEVREEIGHHVALILVANKTDLVRSRVVTDEEGRTAAQTYDSKYIEVSAAIDHKIDDLLVGVLKQIRLFRQRYSMLKHGHGRNILGSCYPLKTSDNVQDVFAKLFKGGRQTSKSSDNLYVL